MTIALPSLHPRLERLDAFVDGTLDERDHARIRGHLDSCSRCRGTVAFMDSLRETIAVERAQPPVDMRPRDDALARILERRARGERVDLPIANVAVTRSMIGGGWLAAAALMLAIGAISIGLFTSRDLAAISTGGELRLTPAAPRPGDSISVEYRPDPRLAALPTLVLRARFRTRADEPYNWFKQVEAARLVRGKDGLFRGGFRLPPSSVYAVLAIEDTGAHLVDANGRRLWEVLARGDGARPMYDALEQKSNDLTGRNWELAFATAREATELYPDRVRAWYIRYFFESAVLDRASRDSLAAAHRTRLAAFDARLLPGALRTWADTDDLGALVSYAEALSDTSRAARLGARLLREAPRSFWAIERRLNASRAVAQVDPARSLAMTDSIWMDVGGAFPMLFAAAPNVADIAKNPGALRRWADRMLASGRGLSAFQVGFARQFVKYPELRNEGLRRLRAQAAALAGPNDAERPLERTRAEDSLARREERRRVLVALGEALMTTGNRDEGLDTLEVAAEIGWDASLFRRVAALEAASGDTARALTFLARASADAIALTASERAVVGTRLGTREWAAQVTSARRELRELIMATASSRALPRHLRLIRASDNREVELRDVAASRPTLVVFWSRWCEPSARQLPRLTQLTAKLAVAGVEIVAIASERPSTDLTKYLAERKLSFPVYFAARREVPLAFRNWGTPEYYFLDRDGRLRFEHIDIDRVADVATALLEP